MYTTTLLITLFIGTAVGLILGVRMGIKYQQQRYKDTIEHVRSEIQFLKDLINADKPKSDE